MKVSVIVPIFNEVENIPLLYGQLDEVLRSLGQPYEIIFVDDGSTDGSQQHLRCLAEHNPQVKVIRFRCNFGQTAAMQAGLENATGDVLVTLDGDLQNDPADIPLLLKKIERGLRPGAWLAEESPG